MKICFSSGHGLKIRGASASPRPPYLDEVDEARRVVDRVAQLWRENGVGVETFHDNTSTSQSQNLNTIVNWHNSKSRDYDVSCHFNAYQKTTKAMGTEVLYVTQQKLAADTSAAIAQAAGLPNRGAKKRTDLAFLNGTNKPAILLEVCFVDSEADGNAYRAKFEQICKRIAEVVGKITIGAPPTQPEPEPEPEPKPPTEGNRVEIVAALQGDMAVVVNGALVYGEADSLNTSNLTITKQGDATLVINGEEFHNWIEPEEPGEPETPPPTVPPTRRQLSKGSTGTDVAQVQTTLGIPPDGDFGSQTDGAVKGYQAAMGLSVDGIVGNNTWAELDVLDTKMIAGNDGIALQMQSQIIEIARNSVIASYSWRDRGKPASPGYIPGMALAFALAAGDLNYGSVRLMAKADTGNASIDALTWYADIFRNAGMDNSKDGINTLRHLFVLLMGLGMRESSGDHWCGRDMSASNTSPDTAEAGLFQSSWNLNTASSEIPLLFNEYWGDPNGFNTTFSEKLNPSSANLQNYGQGVAGTQYQWLAKYCPAFAVYMTAVGLRTRRQHWGPINRREAEVRPEANQMLLQVQSLILPMA